VGADAGDFAGERGGSAVAMVAFLVNDEASAVGLRPAVADRLARLGVTTISLLRDREMVFVVLEGWAFDPVSSTEAAARAVGADATSRTFRPVMQSALQVPTEET
jgi:hypothetical protein